MQVLLRASSTARRASRAPAKSRRLLALPRSHARTCRLLTAAAAQPDVQPPPASDAFTDLLDAAGASGSVRLQSGKHGNGLVTTRAVREGGVLLRVPRQACLLLDYNSGLSLRSAPWPELKAALASDGDALPWDLLLALALVDAVQGKGDGFWQAYADVILPKPDELCVPSCQSAARLEQLQHPRVAANAATQQQRLASSFPHLTVPASAVLGLRNNPEAESEHPTLLEWAFACVRSRAFRLGESTFAFVPFLDVANHADAPTSNFRVAADGGVELVAVGDVAQGGEVSVSYTGPGGATSTRLLVQYGFAPASNPADRLDLGLVPGMPTPEALRGSPGAGLSLAVLQEAMGDRLFTEIVSGRASALLAALKSLPTYNSEDGAPVPDTVKSEIAFAAELRQRLAAVEAEFTSALADDEAAASSAVAGTWEDEAARYRVSRKQIAAAMGTILKVYERVLSESQPGC